MADGLNVTSTLVAPGSVANVNVRRPLVLLIVPESAFVPVKPGTSVNVTVPNWLTVNVWAATPPTLSVPVIDPRTNEPVI